MTRDPRCQDHALLDFLSLIRKTRSVLFQTWAARVDTTSFPSNSEIIRHSLLNNEHFRALCKTMETVLDDGGRAVETAVSQVLPQLSHVVKVSVEAVAAASSSCVLDVERRLSLQLEEAVEDLKAHNTAGISAVPDLLGSTAAELRFLRTEVAHLRSLTGRNSCADCHGGGGDTNADSGGTPVAGVVGGREGAGGRVREWGGDGHVSRVAAAVHFPFGSPVSTFRLGATAAVTHGRLSAQPMVVQFPPAVPPPASVPPSPVVSSRLAQDRENVR